MTERILSYGIVQRLVALMLLCCISLCWPLWDVSSRQWNFPVAPVIFEDITSSKIISRWLSIVLVGVLTLLAIWPRQMWLLGGTLLWLIWMCILDVNRLQPWVWMSILIFAVMVLSGRNGDREASTLRLLLAGIYFWSGFNKLTPYFAEGDFTWFLETFSFSRPLAQWPALGYVFAVFELFFAFGLLWGRSRHVMSYVVIGFHLITVFYLGPLGRNWNHVVIPWNMGMAALVYVLFVFKRESQGKDSSWMIYAKGVANFMIIGLVWLAPVLHYWGLWPHGLSWELYTNTQTEVTFQKPNEGLFTTKECDFLFSRFRFSDDGTKMLIEDWAMNDMGVPQFVFETSLLNPARHLCQCSIQDSVGIYVLRVHRFDRSKETLEWIPCSKLK